MLKYLVRLNYNHIQIPKLLIQIKNYQQPQNFFGFSKYYLMEHIWNYHFDPQTNVVDVLVSRLRNKVDVDRTRIHTIRGVGYALRRP